jgi:Cys-tRNA(Pro)/Cys-tRNA(Cys) deacylase
MDRAKVKTNAMRLLDARRVAYEPYIYDDTVHSAEGAAAALGVPADQVFKTIVVLRERGKPLLVMVPGDREVEPRRLARSLGEKAVRVAPQREAERLTGLQVGGISALALLSKPFDICLDRAALAHERIWVSAGQRGVNLRLRVEDLIRVTNAREVGATDGAPGARH